MSIDNTSDFIPDFLKIWFESKGWNIHPHQVQMFQLFASRQSALLVAPTGGGKTLASFLPALIDIYQNNTKNLHTLYISPLKALTQDIHRNLLTPIQEMQLGIEVATRTGDTSTYQRQKQLRKPPHILLTTPESLILLLSYPNAKQFFAKLRWIIVDELHSFAGTKRGDLTSLALAQLYAYAPLSVRIGLSATVAEPKRLAEWLVPTAIIPEIIEVHSPIKPKIHLLASENIPYSGFKAKHAVPEIYNILCQHQMTIVFVNTRANAEFLFRQLWLINTKNLPIALYHGSLSKERRQQIEELTVAGKINAIVATSALELGIDWGNVEAVVQIGAPHGVSRLLQRIGRSNHQMDKPSLAYLVPTNCFDALESLAAIHAIDKNVLDFEEMHSGSLDVVVQFIINSACSEPINRDKVFYIVKQACPYRYLPQAVFYQLFQFAVDGGYTLKHYEQYHRLIEIDNEFKPSSRRVVYRHRQNIGTIIEAARLRVKIMNKRKHRVVGDIEESFVQELQSGDTFLFAGEVLEYIRIHDMFVETRKTSLPDAKLPSYSGGTMPLSKFLAEEVRTLLNHPEYWSHFPQKIQEWLSLQQQFSSIPSKEAILVEQFPYKKRNYLVIYSFEGKRANHSLGMLFTKHLELLNLKPYSFTSTDYSLAICTFKKITHEQIKALFSNKILYDELEKWLQESSLLKRMFRQIAIISGLTERQIAGARKTMKQVTFSTDLIFDVLKKYEPEHILLKITRHDASKLLLDFDRLTHMLTRFEKQIVINDLSRPSPFSIPVLSTFTTEKIKGQAEEDILSYAEIEATAAGLVAEVKKIVS